VTPRTPLLIVESHIRDGQRLAEELGADGYRVDVARSSEHARILARASRPALVLLGGLAEPGGPLGLLEEIRGDDGDWPWRPAVVVLGGGEEVQALRAFDAGADELIATGTGYLELRARLRAVLRRGEEELPSTIEVAGGLHIDTRTHVARAGETVLALRRLEFALLAHLAREPRRVFSRAELLAAVWGYRAPGATRTLESHASRLRRKLAAAGAPGRVVNVRGVGYRLL
jgi:DNA-binding response OmpR family regulator